MCGWFTRTGGVEIRSIGAAVYPAQLIVCGRPWIEPVCSAKVRVRKGAEAASMIDGHNCRGGSVTFGVLTAGDHHDWDPFDVTMNVIRSAWSSTTRSGDRQYARLRQALGIIGTSLAPEITYGDGWHPHFNVLWWHDRELSAYEAADMIGTVIRLWNTAIRKQGRYLNLQHGVRVIPNATGEDLGEYVAKVQDDWTLGAEMTRGDVKRPRAGGRLPFTILADHYRTGDLADWQRWQDYSRGVLTGGQRSIAILRHSPRLRARLGVPAASALTDEQLAAIEVGGVLLGVIADSSWRRIRMRRLAPAMLAAAEAGGLEGLNEWLASYELPPAVTSPATRSASAATAGPY